jgi:hypothetical protein
MSRGFWAVIGAIAGFFIGGWTGEVVGVTQAHRLALGPGGAAETGGDLAAIGAVIGIPCGCAIAWFLAGRRQRRS